MYVLLTSTVESAVNIVPVFQAWPTVFAVETTARCQCFFSRSKIENNTSMPDNFMPPPESAITSEEWQQTPARVQQWVREVWAENQQFRETVEQLREIVYRNSQNSSQPPSQDRPDQKPTREPSGPPRRRGGQPGHPGHHRTLVEEVDEVVVYKPFCCEQCGALLLGEDPEPYRHQVTELPIIKPKVTEYQVHAYCFRPS